jgi:DNA topoisomerase-1
MTSKKGEYLVIVESPSKIHTIHSFLGKKYNVVATTGHFKTIHSLQRIRDFFTSPSSSLSQSSLFKEMEDKSKKIRDLRRTIQLYDNSNIFIATDNDREGESIAFHIINTFELEHNTKRIKFNEISSHAITEAIAHPTTVNMPLVNAQITRMCIDYVIGFTISPLLYNLTHSHLYSLSAGRCQTVALRIVYENYKKSIDKKDAVHTMHRITAVFFEKHPLKFTFSKEFETAEEVVPFLEASRTHIHRFMKEKKSAVKRPPFPFNTAKLLQSASSLLGYSPKKTMSIAQKLYQSGKITYLRTENTKYSKEFIDKTVKYIVEKYGDKFVGVNEDERPRLENDILHGENPHEAIRPTDLNGIWEETEPLYKLIWKNTIQSCMSPAIYDVYELKIDSPYHDELYTHSLETPVFLGWKKELLAETPTPTSSSSPSLPTIILFLNSLTPTTQVYYSKIESEIVHKNQHAPHYTESSLIQKLEDLGIGRPSTYSYFVETIKERGYVIKTDIDGTTETYTKYTLSGGTIKETNETKTFEKEKNKLVIQPIGIVCIEYLLQHFNDLFKYEYTNEIELKLDEISSTSLETPSPSPSSISSARDCLYFSTIKEFIEYIDGLIQLSTTSTKKPIKKEQKISFAIDEHHEFVFYQYGLCVRRKISETSDDPVGSRRRNVAEPRSGGDNIVVDTVEICTPAKKKKTKPAATTATTKIKKIIKYEYYPIKKTIVVDFEKIQNGTYAVEDILEYPETLLGEYNGTPLKIKTGQYGHYLEWGNPPHLQKKTLNNLDNSVSLYTFDLQQAIDCIEGNMKELMNDADKKRIFRVLDPFTSIRQGRYGTYIYHKTEDMHKPKFISLKKCPIQFMTAPAEELIKWVATKK